MKLPRTKAAIRKARYRARIESERNPQGTGAGRIPGQARRTVRAAVAQCVASRRKEVPVVKVER